MIIKLTITKIKFKKIKGYNKNRKRFYLLAKIMEVIIKNLLMTLKNY